MSEPSPLDVAVQTHLSVIAARKALNAAVAAKHEALCALVNSGVRRREAHALIVEALDAHGVSLSDRRLAGISFASVRYATERA